MIIIITVVMFVVMATFNGLAASSGGAGSSPSLSLSLSLSFSLSLSLSLSLSEYARKQKSHVFVWMN